MKIDLKVLLNELGLPVGLVALFAAIIGLCGVELDSIMIICEGLFGTSALIALLVNVLKWTGVVNDGTAGKWSAGFNLAVIVLVTVVFKLYPSFDFGNVDAQIAEFVRVAGIICAYIIQIVGTKRFHRTYVYGLGVRVFSHHG